MSQKLFFTYKERPLLGRVLASRKNDDSVILHHWCISINVCTLQAQLSRSEQELQQLREQGAPGDSSSSAVAEAVAASIAPGVVSHAEAVDAELAELTRVNSQLRGEIVARSSAWREEKVNHRRVDMLGTPVFRLFGREIDFRNPNVVCVCE